MSDSKQSCVSLAKRLDISPEVMLRVARLLGSSKLRTVADSVESPVGAHIVELHSDPTRASQWNRLLRLATLSSSCLLGSSQARELAGLARELRYLSAEQAAREKFKAEAQKRKDEVRAARQKHSQTDAERRNLPSTTSSEPRTGRRRSSTSSNGALPLSKYDEYPEYLWREVPNGHPGTGRRR